MKITSTLFVLILPMMFVACGSDKKKSDPKPTVAEATKPSLSQTLYHFDENTGVCAEFVKEEWDALGAVLPGEIAKGPCPESMTLLGQLANRYVSCPASKGSEYPQTTVFYTKAIDSEDGTLIDMTLVSKEELCSSANEA